MFAKYEIIYIIIFIIYVIIVFLLLSKKQISPKTIRSTHTNLSNICSTGTVYDENKNGCKIDDESLFDQMFKQKYIKLNKFKNNLELDLNNYDKESITNKWFDVWYKNNGFSCEKVLEKSSGCKLDCKNNSLHCSNWRGNTYKDNFSNGDRIGCSNNKCVCKNGYCAINGICVSPFKIDKNKNYNSICCPSCIDIDAENGGCAGKYICDTKSSCPLESIVEYPGIVFKLKQGKTMPSIKTNSTRGHHIIFDDNTFELDTEKINNNLNEYECAVGCVDKGITDIECSKKCLPKMWTWLPLFENDSGGLPGAFRGFFQLDMPVEEMDIDVSNYKPFYCPPGTCSVDRPIESIKNCKNCRDCEIIQDSNSPNELNTVNSCGSCKDCEITLLDNTGVTNATIECNSSTIKGCENCKKLSMSGVNFFNTRPFMCDTCNKIKNACKLYTLNPYTYKNGEEIRSSDAVIYNIGQELSSVNRRTKKKDFLFNTSGIFTDYLCEYN